MRFFFLFVTLITIADAQSKSLHDVANDSANIVTKILGSFQGTSSMNLTQFFSSFDVPSCLRRCMPAMDNVGMLLDVARKPEVMKSMCQNLTESSKCATSAGCDDTFVGAISNAFQFVCMDNMEKVSSQIECIQENAGDLQQECETECAVQAEVIEKASKNTADQLFNMAKLCNSTTCIANCYQNNLHKYCEIGEDNVLNTIFAQFESLSEQSRLGYLKKGDQNKTGISKLFEMMLPDECNNEKFKIKIPKKIDLSKPKSVGSSAEVGKELFAQKNTLARSPKNITDSNSNAALLAKSGNLSSAALMYNGRIQTLQCQFLDTHGNPQNTPDFETLSGILSEHFNKKDVKTTRKPHSEDTEVEKKACREASSDEPQTRNSGSITFISIIFSFVILNSL